MKNPIMPPCPFTKRCDDPQNVEEAYAYTLHEDAGMLYVMARVSPEHFQKQLEIMQLHIDAYKSREVSNAKVFT